MIGAIAGDIIGSVYEHHNIKSEDFPLFVPNSTFTDDTVLTVALADSILTGEPYTQILKEYYYQYPYKGYGGMFHHWARSSSAEPYNSFGNGSAMRVSPVGFAYNTLEDVLTEAEKSAAVTHNHPEGIKGAQAVAAAIFLARRGSRRSEIQDFIATRFAYLLDEPLEILREHYEFDETCQGSVPQAIIAFLASSSYEDAIRKAVSLCGDSDTIACIAGGIAEAYYGGVPEAIQERVFQILDAPLGKITRLFGQKYGLAFQLEI